MSCEHIIEYKKKYGTMCKRILEFCIKGFTGGKLGSKRIKARSCVCAECKKHTEDQREVQSEEFKCQRIHACLNCAYFGCFTGEKHIHSHANTLTHNLAVDTIFGHIYCFVCQDYKYDLELEQFAEKLKSEVWDNHELDLSIVFLKIKELKDKENKDKHYHFCDLDGSYLGMRGMFNFGNNCYANCILQALIHAPVFRDYLLANKHTCQNSECMVCQMKTYVHECFSGNTDVYYPTQLIYTLYVNKHLSDFRGQKMGDAGEFLEKLIDILFSNIHDCEKIQYIPECSCIICITFVGNIEIKQYCSACKIFLKKEYAFSALNLNLEKKNDCINKLEDEDLFNRYTNAHAENLKCDRCGNECENECRKICTISKLPLILAVKIERISFSAKGVIKVTNKIKYPEILDVTPYTSIYSEDFNNQAFSNGITRNKYLFYLFAVVCHRGKNSNDGHYICYIRQHKSNWFKCNDTEVSAVQLADVLNPPYNDHVYMLFYHKKIIEYEEKQEPNSGVSKE